jgi:hypothetical protein
LPRTITFQSAFFHGKVEFERLCEERTTDHELEPVQSAHDDSRFFAIPEVRKRQPPELILSRFLSLLTLLLRTWVQREIVMIVECEGSRQLKRGLFVYRTCQEDVEATLEEKMECSAYHES